MTTTATPPAGSTGPAGPGRRPRPASPVIRMGRRSSALLVVVTLVGFVAFTWPLFTHPHGSENLAHSSDAPWLFVLVLPLLLAIVLSELADGTLDSKAVAVLGVLAACGAAVRLPSGGVTGFAPIFFLLLPAGRVYGRGFGFVLGALTMFASALLTGGVGPWLPYEMFGMAWVGFFAGCLPRASGHAEITLLGVYGFVAGLAYGLLLNLWFWPFAVSGDNATAFVAGAPLGENLRRFLAFDIATSLGFDLPRAVTNLVLVVVMGRPVLVVLRRAARRASFGIRPTFGSAAEVAAVPPTPA